MHTSKRNAKALSILAAAAGLTSIVQFAHATPPSFTWNNSTTGNWSVGNNWIGGTAPNAGGDPTYDLLFRNSGAAYTATNDLGAFNLAVLRFNNTGANAINLAGNAINLPTGNSVNFLGGNGAVNVANGVVVNGNGGSFGPKVTVIGTGASNFTITGPITSAVATGDNAGGVLEVNRATGTLSINGGADLLAIRAETGNIVQNGGTVRLHSVAREGDPFGTVAQGLGTPEGYWSLGIGNTTTTSSYTMNGGTLIADNGFAAISDGSSGVMNFNNAAVATFLAQTGQSSGRFGVNAGNGTINITGGSVVTARLTDALRQSAADPDNPYTAVFNINGAGSRHNTGQFLMSRQGGNGTLTIAAGGVMDVSLSPDGVPDSGSGIVSIAGGTDTAGTPFPGNASALITGPGSAMNIAGELQTSEGGLSTMTISLGAKMLVAPEARSFLGLNSNGTVSVESGSTFTMGSQTTLGATGGTATLLISSGGAVSAAGPVFQGGEGAAGGGTVIMSGATSTYHTDGQYAIGSPTAPDLFRVAGGTATLDASDPDNLGTNLFISDSAGDKTVIQVDGANSHFLQTGKSTQFSTSWNTNTNTTISVTNGAEMSIAQGSYTNGSGTLISGLALISEGATGKTTITVDGAGSRLITGDDVRFADDVSEATLNISNGGSVSMGDQFSIATFQDGVGSSRALVNITGTNSTLAAPVIVANGLYVDNVGTELGGGASTISITAGGTLKSSVAILGNQAPGGAPDSGASTFSVTGAGSKAIFNDAQFGGGDAVGELDIALGDGSSATLNIGAGASVIVANGTGANVGSSQFFTAGGLDSKTVATNAGTLAMGDFGVHGWDGQATLTNSGTVTGFDMIVGINGVASNSLHGAGTINNSGTIAIGDELDVGLLGLGSINSVAGNISVGSNLFMGVLAGPQSRGVLNVNGGVLTVGDQAQLGGAGGTLGGVATLAISNNGAATIGTGGTGLLAVYQNSTVTIGSGSVAARLNVNGDTSVDGHVFYNSGTFKTTGELNVAGEVRLSNAARNVNGVPSNKKTLEAGSLSFAGISGTGTNTIVTGGIVDLNDNDALFHGNTLSGNGSLDVAMQIRSGRNGGTWNGQGIISTAAALNASKHTGLGAISGADYKSASSHAGTTSFNGLPLANTDTVVKYTYNGDADLNGSITGADYSKIDTTFNNEHTAGNIGGWFNGDFNYDGKVDGQDYGLIDAAFNIQKAPPVVTFGRGDVWVGQSTFASTGMDGADAMSADLNGHDRTGVSVIGRVARGERVGMVGPEGVGSGTGNVGVAVPEPSVLGLVGISLLGAFSRRRRAAR